MIRLAQPLTLLCVLLISVGLATTEVRAGEEPPVVRALLDSAALAGAARPTYRSLDVAGDGTITLSHLEATMEGDDDTGAAITYTIESLVLTDVDEITEGLFEIGAAEWSNTTLTSGGRPLAAIPLITGKSVYLHQPSDEPTALERVRASNMQAKEYLVPEALMLVAGHSLMLEDLSTSWQGDPVTGSGTTRFAARRIHIPGALVEDAGPLSMGYGELEFALQGTTTSIYSDEALGFDMEMRLDGRDMGSLIIDLGADGIPLALFAALDGAESEPDKLLPFAGGVSLKRVTIRFEDDSLTGRLLAVMAEAEGMEVDSFVAEVTEDIEMGLKDFLEHNLAQQVSASLTAYLNDPKAITFALTPKLPVSFDQLMAGLEDPLALIELLQVSVTAND